MSGRHYIASVHSAMRLLLPLLSLASLTIGCHATPPAEAPLPRYGVSVPDGAFPGAAARYTFSPETTHDRSAMAAPLADRLVQRALELLSFGQERTALASIRLATMLLREGQDLQPAAETPTTPTADVPWKLSDAAVDTLRRAVERPAARGDEGTALGLYTLWSLARPQDPAPREHLKALAAWSDSAPQLTTSPLILAGRRGVRSSDALAYLPHHRDLQSTDTSLLDWMERTAAFRDGARSQERYSDEVYYAVLGLKTAGFRLLCGHLRDGDINGALEAAEAPQTLGMLPEPLQIALREAGPRPGASELAKLISTLLKVSEGEGVEEPVSDAVVGLALLAASRFPREMVFGELVARGFQLAGSGDAAPAILATALCGTEVDACQPPVRELSRALSAVASSLRDYRERGSFEGAERTFAAAGPLLQAHRRAPQASPTPALLTTLLAYIDAENGQLARAAQLFEVALHEAPLPMALAGRARLYAREGDRKQARELVTRALKEQVDDVVVRAELLALAGDLARRDGDFEPARQHYEQALRLLVNVRASVRSDGAVEASRRLLLVLSRFTDGAPLEEMATLRALPSTSVDLASAGKLLAVRMLRAFREGDGVLARSIVSKAAELAIAPGELLRLAIAGRMVRKRAGLPADEEMERIIASAASGSDSNALLAKAALGQLAGMDLLASAKTPRQQLEANFLLASLRWAEGGLAAAKAQLVEVSRSTLLGSWEIDVAQDLLEPERATVAGQPKIPGL